MTVIATVGLPGSGKGEAAAVAEDLEIPVITMGDVIRDECRSRGLDPATHHGEVAKSLREEHGPDIIAQRTIERVEDLRENHELVVVDGVRSDTEVDRFNEAYEDFVLVSIEAPFEMRLKRLSARNRDKTDTAAEALKKRDQREQKFGMEKAMKQADIHIENTDTLETFRNQIRELLRTHKQPA